jgi:hypothetical protein
MPAAVAAAGSQWWHAKSVECSSSRPQKFKRVFVLSSARPNHSLKGSANGGPPGLGHRVQLLIFCGPGLASRRCRPLSSNVRPRNSGIPAVASSKPCTTATLFSQSVKCASRSPAEAGSQFVGHAEYGVQVTSCRVKYEHRDIEQILSVRRLSMQVGMSGNTRKHA